jgi:hypothetical protein
VEDVVISRNLGRRVVVSRGMAPTDSARTGTSRNPVRAPLVRFAMVLLLVAIAGCSGEAGSNLALPGTGPLMTVQTRGGMCPEGMCDATVIVERDGLVHSAAKPPNNLGLVAAPAMADLTAAVNATDWAALKAKPFTGECPIAFDGQEQIFEFTAGTETHRIASCEVEIDWGHPLFIAVTNALGEWIAIPF